MGAKRASNRKQSNANANANFSYNNVVNLNTFQKPKTVHILPRNKNQETYVLTLLDPKKDIVFGIGPAGTGKTMLAVQVAVKQFKEGLVDKIIVTRPAVSVDEDLGFLPGTLEEKMAPWTRPIFDVLREYFNAKEITGMIEEGIIEIAPLAYMRGRTFKNAFILADEMQNATPNQMKMLLTRLGEGSKMAVTGDLNQADRVKDNGLIDFINHLDKKQATRLDIVRFAQKDIERHEAVKEVLQVYGDE
jgi:phosphate starvation-inducible PhoH-like protein